MKVHFHMNTGFAGADHEEDVEYPDDVSEDQIQKDLEDWAWEHIDLYWEKSNDNRN